MFMALLWLWPPDRFVLASYPLLWIVLVRSVGPMHQRILGILGAALCAWGLGFQAWQCRVAIEDGNAPLYASRGDNWKKLREIGIWLRDRSEDDEVVATLQDGAIGLLSGRKVIFPVKVRPMSLFYGGKLPALGDVPELIENLRRYRIRFVVLTPSRPFSESAEFRKLVLDAARENSECLRMASEFGHGFKVFEFTCRISEGEAKKRVD